jgi:hypothetical protein
MLRLPASPPRRSQRGVAARLEACTAGGDTTRGIVADAGRRAAGRQGAACSITN